MSGLLEKQHVMIFVPFDFHLLKPAKAEKGTLIKKKEGGDKKMCDYEERPIISSYSLRQAIADEVLVEIFKDRWKKLGNGKPIVATAHLYAAVSKAALIEISNEFVRWRKETMPTLPEEDQLFHTEMNGKTVWVIEDGAAFTLMYPEDY